MKKLMQVNTFDEAVTMAQRNLEKLKECSGPEATRLMLDLVRAYLIEWQQAEQEEQGSVLLDMTALIFAMSFLDSGQTVEATTQKMRDVFMSVVAAKEPEVLN